MPGNQIVINKGIEYYVGDSKMEELLSWLGENGVKISEESDNELHEESDDE